jgi:hypothetical protein
MWSMPMVGSWPGAEIHRMEAADGIASAFAIRAWIGRLSEGERECATVTATRAFDL